MSDLGDAIANAECVRYGREFCVSVGDLHPECAAAAARQWFTDWLREQKGPLADQLWAIFEDTRDGRTALYATAEVVTDEAIAILTAALGGDQATGATRRHLGGSDE